MKFSSFFCTNTDAISICFFHDLGWRGDDCGFCPPGLPGGKGERGDSGM